MKKFTTMAYVAALALVGTAGLSSCKSNNEVEGDFDGETVKSEFSIALPDEAVGDKGGLVNRMPGADVQIKGRSQFQGITSITLVPYAKATDIEASDVRLGNNINLGDITIDGTNDLTSKNAKVYPNVSIPLTTASFLFYGKSAAASGTKFDFGSLNAVSLDNNHEAADFSFALEPILSGSPTASGTAGEALIAYLNSIANATDGTTAWKNYTAGESAAMTAMFETFSSWHSLSSFAIARGLTDLYNSLVPLTTTLATNIKTAIANATYASVSGPVDGKYTVSLNSSPLDLTQFPTQFNIPEGSVRIKYNSTAGEFQACTSAEYTSADNTPLELYTYPAALWYYANSQIATSDSSRQSMYNSTNEWSTILAAHRNATAVNSRTRAVAIRDIIQYGVARLDVIVKLSGSDLEDNTPVTAQTISCNNYPLTAVLVGGQKNVKFDFTPIADGTEYTIYDKSIEDNNNEGGSISVSTTNTKANSTLVLQSETGSAKDVMIAIELQNNSGKDFIGVGGELIAAGSKFYMVAKLTAAGANVTANTVFMQDYTTTATLTIGNLKNAYNTIPDLRTPQLELGMSVDLTWTAGNTYDITIN